jgi:hypothetical protein
LGTSVLTFLERNQEYVLSWKRKKAKIHRWTNPVLITVSIIEGLVSTNSFTDFIDSLLDKMNLLPGMNSVIVMDNCCIHKADTIRERIEAWYMTALRPFVISLTL